MKIIRSLYNCVGKIQAKLMLGFWNIRDLITPPQESAILFVAHPDDDVLFFHKYIQTKKPYVVCLTSAGLLKRIIPFYRAMRHYGVRYRAYDMNSRAVDEAELVKRRVKAVLKKGKFKECATHNSEGEYGHVMHKCIHDSVCSVWQNRDLYMPVQSSDIENYPLSKDDCLEKDLILRTFYKGEYPTLETFEKWIRCEALNKE